jgi:hypothetical protein
MVELFEALFSVRKSGVDYSRLGIFPSLTDSLEQPVARLLWRGGPFVLDHRLLFSDCGWGDQRSIEFDRLMSLCTSLVDVILTEQWAR